jgi:NAD(P)-dependent dehydrogenase (short-subunit alcohol dehydrogenase family)
MSFDNKIALITGGAAGIGRATALQFAKRGANVLIADLSVEQGQETVAQLQAFGAEALFVETDVTDAQSVAQMVTACVEKFGQLDYAINNAGVELEWAPVAEGDESQFDQIMAVNVKGVWLCLRQEIRQMLLQKSGAIVNTASIAAMTAAPNMAAYAASKHAVIGLTRTAAVETAESGIRINAVCPGVIETEMTKRAIEKGSEGLEAYLPRIHAMGRIGTADEVANAILWLCSDESSFTTGAVLPVEGGRLAR